MRLVGMRMSGTARLVSAWAASVFLLAAGCGTSAVEKVRTDDRATLWTIDAGLLQTKDAPLRVCMNWLDSLPPAGCGGVELRGVDIDSLPNDTRATSGMVWTGPMHVIGTYGDGVLTVTEQPRKASETTPPAEHRPIPPPSCPAPAGGWPFDKVDRDGRTRVSQYVYDAPDGGSVRIDASQRIMTAPFTGDLDRHRKELAALYDGPVCVELVKASRTELAKLSEKVIAEVKRAGFGYLGGATENAFGTVEVIVAAATEQQRKDFTEAHDGLVEIESFLHPA
jgi:hypothetical protein